MDMQGWNVQKYYQHYGIIFNIQRTKFYKGTNGWSPHDWKKYGWSLHQAIFED